MLPLGDHTFKPARLRGDLCFKKNNFLVKISNAAFMVFFPVYFRPNALIVQGNYGPKVLQTEN